MMNSHLLRQEAAPGLTSAEQSDALDPRGGALSFPPVIGFLLVVQVPDASDVGCMTVLLRPLDRFVLRLTSGEDVVCMVLDNVVGDVSTLLPTLGAGLDVHDCHLSLLVSTTPEYIAARQVSPHMLRRLA
jgi:hypothetical protein